jgi:hypothetical protein
VTAAVVATAAGQASATAEPFSLILTPVPEHEQVSGGAPWRALEGTPSWQAIDGPSWQEVS